jgi:hypothetical protein
MVCDAGPFVSYSFSFSFSHYLFMFPTHVLLTSLPLPTLPLPLYPLFPTYLLSPTLLYLSLKGIKLKSYLSLSLPFLSPLSSSSSPSPSPSPSPALLFSSLLIRQKKVGSGRTTITGRMILRLGTPNLVKQLPYRADYYKFLPIVAKRGLIDLLLHFAPRMYHIG